MKALVFGGPGQRSWDSVDDPGIQDPTDVIVKVDTTTICGTDLHILKGDVPAVTEGRILGHEAVGTVVETGAAVSGLSEGDRVLVPAITSCGRCGPCKAGMAAHCEAVGGIGWIFGHLIDGVQAEFARVPYAETSVHVVPEGVTDEQVLFLADILPTGYEIGVQNGRVQPGDTIAVVGAGPVGLAAVGVPATFDLCTRIVRASGTVANIGVHGAPTTLHLEDLWIKNITITTGLVSGSTVPKLGTHHFALGEIERGLRRVRRRGRARRAEGGAQRVAASVSAARCARSSRIASINSRTSPVGSPNAGVTST